MSRHRAPPDDDAIDTEHADLLEAVGHASAMSRNDPDYHAGLEEMARDVADIANEVASVHLIETKGGAHIEVGLQRGRHRPTARRTAIALARVLEAPVVVTEQPRPGHQHADHGYHQIQQHRHYKDDKR